jgi:hypothetical protein
LIECLLRHLPQTLQVQGIENLGSGSSEAGNRNQDLALGWIDLATQVLTQATTDHGGLDPDFLPLGKPLAQVLSQLSWQLIRHSYPLTCLLQGIEARILQPEWGWEQGSLRLIAILSLRNAAVDLQLDVTRGTVAALETLLIVPDILVQVDTPEWPSLKEPMGQFRCRIIQQLAQHLPELALLTEGLGIEFCSPNQAWQAGTLGLRLELAFQ